MARIGEVRAKLASDRRWVGYFDRSAFDSEATGVREIRLLPTVEVAWCDRFFGVQVGWLRWGWKLLRKTDMQMELML